MIKSYLEQLEEVQTAITQILQGGQSYSVLGRSLSRADLPTLYAQEQRLRILADREQNNNSNVGIQFVILP